MKSEIIKRLEQYISDECKAIDREKAFDDMLDECYSFEKVGGPFEYMSPSAVLKEMDPTGYRCGVNDYEDAEGWVEVAGDYYDQREAEKAKEQFIEDLKSSISDLESEIEDLEAEEDPSLQDIAAKKEALNSLQAELKECEKHSF